MSGELSVVGGMRANPVSGGLIPGGSFVTKTVDLTEKETVGGVIACTTTPANISTTGLSTLGFGSFANQSTTVPIIIAADDGTGYSDAFYILPWGGTPMPAIPLIPTGTTYQARTASGTATLLFEITGGVTV